MAMAWHSGAAGLTRRDWLWLAALGLSGYYLSSLFDFLGLQYISAGLERLILFTYPTLVLLFSALFLGHRIRPAAWGALALCYAGIGLAVSHDLTFAGETHNLTVGSLWVFASAVSYALFWMGSGHVVARIGAMRLSAIASIFACLFVLGHFAAMRPLAALAVRRAPTLTAWPWPWCPPCCRSGCRPRRCAASARRPPRWSARSGRWSPSSSAGGFWVNRCRRASSPARRW